ncbi:MAG: hypothetical protein BWK77_01645 [Verrucomicrobia bacterium A1]|nr:MAG: hypothetical protein BWK77_01645 [Verrucomicrobia bacterium A1]
MSHVPPPPVQKTPGTAVASLVSQAAQIGHACLQYEIEKGKLPRSLSDLEKYSPGISALKCPLVKDGGASYELAGMESTSVPDSNARVLLRETEPRHRGRRATVFDDGHVEMRTDP